MGCCQNSILEGENPLANEKAILKVEANDIPSPFDGALQQSLDSSSISSENPNNQKLGFLKSLAEKSENSLPMKDFPISEAFANISQQQVLPVNFKQIVKPLSRFGEIAKNAVKEVKEREDIIDIERKLERGMTNAGKIIVDQADFVGDALKEGYEQSADLINSQVALIKEGLDDAMQAVKDLKIKKRLNDIVYPVLRKVFIHSVTCDIETKYNVLEIIGQGSLSTVKRVVEKLSGLERAAKIIVKSTLSDKQTESLVSEVETLKQLDHQNIVRVVEIVEEVSKLCIITELCAGGELFDRIMLCKGFDELMASKLMYQILSGLVHIHQNGFIHRDLKPENLLFMDKDSDTLKIIDFGITTDLTSLTRKKTSCVGSAYYISPEAISGHYDFKSDVWSCGVILYILLCGKPPFPGKNEQEIFSKITRGVVRFSDHKWKNISKEAKELIFKMLCKDLNQRISASEAFSHPWVQNSQTQTIKTSEISPKVIQNLSHFQAGSRLQQVTLSFIASIMFSGQEMKELREAFIILDTNGDGHLTKDELQRGFSTISISGSARLEDILADCDIDMNGMIDYSEFLTAALDWQKHLSEEMLEKAFKAYDRDESGGISIREIKQFLGAGEDEPDDIWDDILKEADENGDGEIDMSEFKTLMFSRFKLK